jgi:RAB protein geranylgeranyltransferase component A
MFALVSKYGLEDDTVDFIGHALALHRDDNYLDEPAIHSQANEGTYYISTLVSSAQSQVEPKKILSNIIS